MTLKVKGSQNGTDILAPADNLAVTGEEAQQLFSDFLKQHGLKVAVYVLSPRTQTPMPVAEFLPPGWDLIAVRVVVNGNS